MAGVQSKEPSSPVNPALDGQSISAEHAAVPIAVGFDVLRLQINTIVASNAVEMVQAMIDRAKKGQPQALKYLFQMIGLYPATSDDRTSQGGSLAQLLLKRIGISQEQKYATKPDAAAVREERMP